MATRTLYLIRHGQYNPDESSNPTGKLTKLGKRQARRLVKVFKDIPLSAIHYSTMKRAEETAEPLLKAYPDTKQFRARRLWEVIPPVDAETRNMFFKDIPPDELDNHHEDVERAFEHYVRPTRGKDKHEIIISHGNLIRYFMCRAIDVPPTSWINMVIHNCSITRIIILPNGGYTLLSFNETLHLPPELHTDNLYNLTD